MDFLKSFKDHPQFLVLLGAAAAGGFFLGRRSSAVQGEAEADSTTSSSHTQKIYETSVACNQYLQFHFGEDADILPYSNGPHAALNFAARTADICTQWAKKMNLTLDSAFDVGCSVGGTSYALSKDFSYVVGLDFSQAFVDCANRLKDRGHAEYTASVEGELTATYLAKLPEGVNASRTFFLQGDACNLPSLEDMKMSGRKFSVIHGANLLCRLPDPKKFLVRLPGMLVSGGLVVFVSPYSWLKQYTPKTNWIGGFYSSDGSAVTANYSRDGLIALMTDLGFKLLHEEECPFLIREHVRKYQWGCSHVTVWQLTK